MKKTKWKKERKCCNLKKGYWMRNNQNGGWKWNGNLYTLTNYKTRQQREEGKPPLVVTALVFVAQPTKWTSTVQGLLKTRSSVRVFP